jgi:c-di-GMP-binding flagellar brake protein YcgR
MMCPFSVARAIRRDMNKRRRHKRIIISGSATLQFTKKGESQTIQTLIANISLQGIGLYSYSSIKVGTCVSITTLFVAPDGGLKTDSIEGRVVSSRKIGKTHFLGIQLDREIDAQNQPSLFKHLQNDLTTDMSN